MAARANQAQHRVAEALLGQLTTLTAAGHNQVETLSLLTYLAVDTLQALSSPTRAAPSSLGDHLYQREIAYAETAERLHSMSAGGSAASLARQLVPLLGEFSAAMSHQELPNTVNSTFGSVRLIDYLRANCIHAVDLAYRVTGAPAQPALTESVRALVAALSERFPGRSIEFRVPPVAAVQVGSLTDGPTHTRGTPPNVIETNPRVFVALATGRMKWNDAWHAGQLNISGVHADEAARMIPIIRL